MIKICHITTVHSRNDVRIFHKQAKSLSACYEVSLIVADGLGDEIKDGISIYDIGRRQDKRLKRAISDSLKAYHFALKLDCQLYHFHDPELIWVMTKLIAKGKKVIYDVHEDLPRQIISKPYLSNFIKPLVSGAIEFFENIFARKMSFVITATPHIRERFLKVNAKTIDINNFPKIDDIQYFNSWENREKKIGYIGGIFKTRGILETLDAIQNTDIMLVLAGSFSPQSLETECRNHAGWSNVDYRGFLGRDGINKILEEVKLGLVILEDTPNYIFSLPVKMFEYMASGLPVIASNFKLWEEIVVKNDCGFTINPKNSNDLKMIINRYINENQRLAELGSNGRKAVLQKYNWGIEESKLLKVYHDLIGI